MALPKEIAALIETFAANEADYTAPEFKEAQVRQQFIDPLFAALGWDVANTSGYAEAYKEVMHEDALKIGGETKAPDYSFRIGGNRKFFVEAKKPSVLIKDHPEPAYQLRRYSWSAKLPLGILTDFQEFAIYDGRVKPSVTDKASVARLFYCRYDELEKHWDFIAGTFSKEAVLKGSFDKYAASTKGKRGTTTVDDAFLEEIEKWRTLLARNLALRNPSLDTRGLNFAVQRTIDRIVFLRIAEDRGNEPFGQLQALLGSMSANEESAGGTLEEEPAAYGGGKPKRPPTIYPRLVQIFEKADYRYNSGLFHFAKDSDCAETPDTLTPGLHIDDAVFKEILDSLYYPKSPYVFTVLPAYILGHVYEQFLGKVIRLTDGHRAEIEEKPEVRKAGGVYYTPQYIVDYIVQKTVGPLVEGKTPKQLETLAVLDPACGSGTFLLGAYDYLLKWYLDYYSNHDAETWAKGPSVAFKLPSKKQSSKVVKQGPLAAEDVKIKKFARIYEVAPNVGKDAFGQSKTTAGNTTSAKSAKSWALSTEERKRILLTHIHGVDIDSQAVEVTKLSLLLKVLEGERREFQGSTVDLAAVLPDLSQNIRCGNSLIGHDFYQQPNLPDLDAEAKYKLNTFEWKDGFPEVMKRGGFDAVIGNPPYVLLQAFEERPIFNYISKTYSSARYKIDTYHVFFERALKLCRPEGYLGYITPSSYLRNKHALELRKAILGLSEPSSLRVFYYPVFDGASVDTSILVLKRQTKPKPITLTVELSETRDTPDKILVHNSGDWIQHQSHDFNIPGNAGSDELLEKIQSSGSKLGDFANAYFGIQTHDREKFVTTAQGQGRRPVVDGINIGRYTLKPATEYVDFRPESIKSGGKEFVYEQDRIGVRQIGAAPVATYLPKGLYTLNTIYNIYLVNTCPFSTKALLGIISSKLISWHWHHTNFDQKKTFPKIKKEGLLSIPLPTSANAHQQLTKLDGLVNQMLALHRAQAAAQTPHEKDALAKQITATDRQIDALVYQLYALTPEEIALIENT